MFKKTILLLFVVTSVFSQNNSISGTLTANNTVLPFANVYFKNTRVGTTTDQNGFYQLKNIPPGKYTLVFSSIGFKKLAFDITIVANEQITKNADLKGQDSLKEIVITGTLRPVSKTDSPVPVEVYSKTFFKKNPTPSIFESLQNINGVRPQLNCNICNTGDIHINGLEGPYTFVLIDGMPIVSGLSTVYGLTGIPQALIERVEIVKGPASTLYGSEAVGGIINIITKKTTNAPIISTDNMISSWSETNTDVSLRYNVSKKVNALLGINYFRYQNSIDNNHDNFTDVTLQQRISIFHKMNFQRKSKKLFSIATRYVYEDRWGGEMNWEKKYRGTNSVYGESIYTNRWETFGTYEFPSTENIRFQFSANGHYQDSFYGTVNYDAKQLIGFGQLVYNKQIGNKHNILFGVAYRYTFYDDSTFATAKKNGITNNPSVVHLPGIFIQDEIAINKQHTLLLGGRWDYNSIHGTIVSPRINYKWNSKDNKNIVRLSVGNGFRVANVFTEDHAALTGARTVEFDGKLAPETSWNTNLNYVKKVTTENVFINIDASAFYTHFSNRILPDYETDTNKIIYANLKGYSVSKGISLQTDLTFTNGLNINAGATLMDVSITENNQKIRQILTERFSGVWSISYRLNNNITIDYTGNLYGPMRLPLLGEKDVRKEFSPWFSIQNIQVSKKFSNSWELYGGIKNILNYTPPDNSINSANNPFDIGVDTTKNPELAFDPTYMFASNQGIRMFLGLRYTLF
ncbi:TonB-dependent receptor [Polaribacter tangerinus]|uniref:TonB-dependent receptor n=1 Tax=Polaribacter tangerinus TaxID=1920034 RepID=UPI000B4AD13B|nr:TonB-dependent receptor [Polaribacter tangerinus]